MTNTLKPPDVTDVLLVDDEALFCSAASFMANLAGCTIETCQDPRIVANLFRERKFKVVFTDLCMPEMDGLTLCRQLTQEADDVAVFIVTSFVDPGLQQQALAAGAVDLVCKPLDDVVIKDCLSRARASTARSQRTDITIASPNLRGTGSTDLDTLVVRVAQTDAPVLVTGESGTGKEVVARLLHASSRRRKGPFVAVNCSAIPESLLESELFGHVKGAFSGATTDTQGLFLAAEGGTMLLDEVGDMPLLLQAKLLRALQFRVVRPVGSSKEFPFDVRIVSATHRDLSKMVATGDFRQDLYFRLNVVELQVPALRQRQHDILRLARSLLRAADLRNGRFARDFSHQASEALLAYPWPGNIRELQNCVEYSVALGHPEEIGLLDLPPAVRGAPPSQIVLCDAVDGEPFPKLEDVERAHILRALAAAGQRRTDAARLLGISLRTLQRRLRAYGDFKA